MTGPERPDDRRDPDPTAEEADAGTTDATGAETTSAEDAGADVGRPPWSARPDPRDDIIDIAGDVAHPARVYDYVRGGSDNFESDRTTVEFAVAASSGGIDHARAAVLANQAFLRRALTWLVREAGVRQFLEIGTIMPDEDTTHEVVQAIAPESRVVYANDDPVVLAHAHALSRGTSEGAATYVDANPRDPETILEGARATFVPGEPVAVILVAILHHVDDGDDPHRLVRRFMDAVPPGSYLVVSHLTNEIIADEVTEAAERINKLPGFTLILRSHEQISAFFGGLELVPPGVVAVTEWHGPSTPPPPPEPWPTPFYGALGRKP
jgi:hypothetical protein